MRVKHRDRRREAAEGARVGVLGGEGEAEHLGEVLLAVELRDGIVGEGRNSRDQAKGEDEQFPHGCS